MLDKVFKLFGIFAFIAIVAAGIGIITDIRSRSPGITPDDYPQQAPLKTPFTEALKKVKVDILNTEKDSDKLVILVAIQYASSFRIPFHNLNVKVLDKEGKIIDVCQSHTSTPPTERKTLTTKIVCQDMLFLQQHDGEFEVTVDVITNDH